MVENHQRESDQSGQRRATRKAPWRRNLIPEFNSCLTKAERTSPRFKYWEKRQKMFAKKTKTKRAGLVFNVDRVLRQMKATMSKKRSVRTAAGIYMTAVLEYLIYEVLELSSNVTKMAEMHMIKPRHILLAIRNDHELNVLMRRVELENAGVVVDIESSLL